MNLGEGGAMWAGFGAGGLALLMAAVLLPVQIRCSTKGQVIRELGPRSHHVKRGTPTFGGLSLLAGIAAASLAFVSWDSPVLWACVALLLVFAAIGGADDFLKAWRDDHHGLRVWQKLLLQGLCAAAVLFGLSLAAPEMAVSHLTLPGLGGWAQMQGLPWVLWGALVILATTNAVNLTDGLDGLVSVPLMLAFSALLLCAALLGVLHQDLVAIAAAAVGALCAFLWFNAHPAQIFMGDTGSLALGALLGGVALLCDLELLLLLTGGVFVLNAASVALQVGWFKLSGGRRIFLMAPFHHHLEHLGWSETQTVLRLWLCAFLGCALAVAAVIWHLAFVGAA